jgi:hypothetical protein
MRLCRSLTKYLRVSSIELHQTRCRLALIKFFSTIRNIRPTNDPDDPTCGQIAETLQKGVLVNECEEAHKDLRPKCCRDETPPAKAPDVSPSPSAIYPTTSHPKGSYSPSPTFPSGASRLPVATGGPAFTEPTVVEPPTASGPPEDVPPTVQSPTSSGSPEVAVHPTLHGSPTQNIFQREAEPTTASLGPAA